MSNEQDFHFEVLPPGQQKLWPDLNHVAGLNYTLYGGSAIALRLGHRQSVDFDFFSSAPQNSEMLSEAVPFLKSARQIQDEPDAKSYLVTVGGQDVKLSFFNRLTMGRVGSPSFTPDGVMRLASPEDLMATKVKVIQQRVEAKDYQDLAAMCRAGYGLKKGLGAAETMFAPDFSPILSAKTMIYFEGGNLHELSSLDRQTLVEAVNSLDFDNIPKIILASKDLA
ncbi:MAG: nucleotidyl transferase AbiEii/AbiGii toxin family protein [Deltaproteobacteria bacterium]|jgi:hypothetical protein|nr:nucleotidyl transferase AbiEii/AbiGii toxin family protein [Deltaproteobacteria bacterium]